ncbi:MAG: GTPase, partial [Patiriisocius sp.]
FSPNTYKCDLCSLTFGVFFEKRRWKIFRKTTTLEMVFLHKDQFLKQYKSKWLPKYDFPVILSQEQDMLEIFLSNVDITQAKDVEALIDAIQSRI